MNLHSESALIKIGKLLNHIEKDCVILGKNHEIEDTKILEMLININHDICISIQKEYENEF